VNGQLEYSNAFRPNAYAPKSASSDRHPRPCARESRRGDSCRRDHQDVIVNANGALIKLSTIIVVPGETLQVVNVRTNAEVKCTVANTRTDPKDNERAEVGIIFDEPTPCYWGLSFPQVGT
jgi:hypothetical protein